MKLDYIFYGFVVIMLIWFFARINSWIKKDEQKTFCYCPACKVDLCSNDSLIYESTDELPEVVYKCKNCGNVSWWNFDIAPCPILIKSDEGSSDIKQEEVTG